MTFHPLRLFRSKRSVTVRVLEFIVRVSVRDCAVKTLMAVSTVKVSVRARQGYRISWLGPRVNVRVGVIETIIFGLGHTPNQNPELTCSGLQLDWTLPYWSTLVDDRKSGW